MNEVTYSDAVPFEGYGPGFFRLGGKVHDGNVLASDFGVGAWGGYEDPAALEALADRVDVVLLGTGVEVAHIPVDFRARVEAAGIGVEAMSTASACRTYNVLLSEGRRVAAAVLAL